MSAMPNAHPIRRYVLLRHREPGSPVTRWSIERIGSAPRDAAGARPDAAARRRRAAHA
jgi:hypothetical protein